MGQFKPVFNYVSALVPPVGPYIFDQARLVFLQTAFQGGINQLQDPTRVGPTAYPLLINGRVRKGVVEPILDLLPIQIPNIGNGAQGLYAAGTFLLFFCNGQAYYYNLLASAPAWTLVVTSSGEPLQLSNIVSRIYTCLVPSSSVNYTRINSTNTPSGTITLTTAFTGSVDCVICQDGVNQPWLIFDDGTCRLAQTFSQWRQAANGGNQEYIPIGTITVYINGITYVVSGNTILRSVQGRPCDFVIAVDTNGNSIAGEDAYATSTGVSIENITAIVPQSSPAGSFLVCSLNNMYNVVPDTTTELFAEPTFDSTYLANAGVLNDKSIIDIIGDTAFIDYGGIYSLNAVAQYRFEGRNAPFSKNVQRILDGVIQATTTLATGTVEEQTNNSFVPNTIGLTAAITFNDYALFSVLTNYGQVVMVYDIILSCWVSIDLFQSIADTYIIQFAVAKVEGIYKLYVLTADNRVFQYYGNATYAGTQAYVGEWTSLDPKIEQKPEEMRAVFINTAQTGTVTFQLVVDGKLSTLATRQLEEAAPVDEEYPLALSVTSSPNTDKITATLDDSLQGFKSGMLISWNFNTQLSHVRLESTPILADVSDQVAANIYNNEQPAVYNDN